MKRVFIIVLDSFGVGASPDAVSFNDVGADTLGSVSRSPFFKADNLARLGLFNIDGITASYPKSDCPVAAYGKLYERSVGKDTTTGHWELAGVVSDTPMPTYPDGFPKSVIDEFERINGRRALCNKPYSGTEVIRDYGDRQIETGGLIVYTSGDSVFQIAAHTDTVPLDELYEICERTRKMLNGENAVGRVIARPFTGTSGAFVRTSDRRDFSLKPTGFTLPDAVKKSGLDSISVGKIYDIFAGRGITESFRTHGNTEGMDKTLALADCDFHGLCFVNLVDFDMLYGHRDDRDGYAKAIAEFDAFLPRFMSRMREDDALIITADHGCDPDFPGTDHTREYIPIIFYGKKVKPINLGIKGGFANIGKTAADMLGVTLDTSENGFYDKLCR